VTDIYRMEDICTGCKHRYGNHSGFDKGPCVATEGCTCPHFNAPSQRPITKVRRKSPAALVVGR
jgi:hypothetical protein